MVASRPEAKRSFWRLLVTSSIIASCMVGAALAFVVSPFRYGSVVLHHSASAAGSYATIKNSHVERGWIDAAYHLIVANGTEGVPLGHLESTRRYRWGLPSVATGSTSCNLRGLHVCIVGNYENGEVPPELRSAVGNAIAELQATFGISDDRIVMHRECSTTACPGRHVTRREVLEWVGQERATLSPELRAQHQAVLMERPRLVVLIPVLLVLGMSVAWRALLVRRQRNRRM